MKVRLLLPLTAGWLALAPGAHALDFPDVLAPLRSAARFVVGLVPSFGEDRAESEPPATAASAEGEANTQVADAREAASGATQVVGTVRFAYENFVLIYTPLKTALPAGTKVTTVDKDGVAGGTELSMSTERKGAFLVADVISGHPRSGDLVVTVPGRKDRALADYQVLE
jgi:hypothetical protein